MKTDFFIFVFKFILTFGFMLIPSEGWNSPPLKGVKCMRQHPVVRNLLIDILCAALALVVFALFHHVLPRQEESLGIVISNPAASSDGEDTGSLLPLRDPDSLIASSGVSDAPLLTGRGNRRGGSGKRAPGA